MTVSTSPFHPDPTATIADQIDALTALIAQVGLLASDDGANPVADPRELHCMAGEIVYPRGRVPENLRVVASSAMEPATDTLPMTLKAALSKADWFLEGEMIPSYEPLFNGEYTLAFQIGGVAALVSYTVPNHADDECFAHFTFHDVTGCDPEQVRVYFQDRLDLEILGHITGVLGKAPSPWLVAQVRQALDGLARPPAPIARRRVYRRPAVQAGVSA